MKLVDASSGSASAAARASPPTLGPARGLAAPEVPRIHTLRSRNCEPAPACTVPAPKPIALPLQDPSPRQHREMLEGLQQVVVGASRRRAAPRGQSVGAAVIERLLLARCPRRVFKQGGVRYAASAMLTKAASPTPEEHAWPNRSVEATRNGIGPRAAVVHDAPRGPMPSRAPHLQR